jgi:hypothetical protein
MKKRLVFSVFSVLYVFLIVFTLAVLASYEEMYSDESGGYYSFKSMSKIERIAFMSTYFLSFPVGTAVAVFDADFLFRDWLIFCWVNFTIWLFLLNIACRKNPGT